MIGACPPRPRPFLLHLLRRFRPRTVSLALRGVTHTSLNMQIAGSKGVSQLRTVRPTTWMDALASRRMKSPAYDDLEGLIVGIAPEVASFFLSTRIIETTITMRCACACGPMAISR